MASPFVHLMVVDRAVAALAAGDLLPLFLAGSIAPDADKLGLCTRQASHFLDLSTPSSGASADVSGALTLLHAHPELAAARLAPPARAFVAGYLCHLVADEQWILTVYRPYFGRRSALGGRLEGTQLQWALHLLLEARLAGDVRLHHLIELLRRAPLEELPPRLLPFLPFPAVDAFRQELLRQHALPAGPERAAFAVTGRERATGVTRPADEAARHDAFLASLPALMERAAAYIPAAALAEFDRRATDESAALLGDYLAGRPLQPPRGSDLPPWLAP